MTNVLSSAFVKKIIAEEKLPRSGRQITRDISSAIRNRNTDLLECFQLRTLDDQTIPALEISDIRIVKKLLAEGRGPEWYVDLENYRALLEKRSRTKRRKTEHGVPQSYDDPVQDSAEEKTAVHPNAATNEESASVENTDYLAELLVAYIMHQTLRWLDENGSPVQQDIAIPFKDLIAEAGISRGSISKAIKTAVESNLIECKQVGIKKQAGESGHAAVYSLLWDRSGNYAKSTNEFEGFYLGEGNRTPIPHSFFNQVIPNETLATTKVVATVFRHTVGYQNQYGGGRRFDAPLSFTKIRDYANMRSSTSLALAINEAINKKFIVRLHRGSFTPNAKKQMASVYAVRQKCSLHSR